MNPPLGLLPGWAMHAECWGAAAALGVTHAWLDEWDAHSSLAAYCSRLAALPGTPAIWLGWSLGALVALTLAATAPERVRGLVLVGATPRFSQASDWPSGLPLPRLRDFQHALAAEPEAALAEFLRWVTYPSPAARRALQMHWPRRPPPPLAVLQAGLTLLATADIRPQLGAVRCPCLLIQGAQDAVVAPAAADALARALPDATGVTLGLSHAPFLEQPAAFQAAILTWSQQQCS